MKRAMVVVEWGRYEVWVAGEFLCSCGSFAQAHTFAKGINRAAVDET